MQMSGLRPLHRDMIMQKEVRAIFPFTFNNKVFSCIFIIDVEPYKLLISTLGEKPLVFEFDVKSGYIITAYMEESEYKKLIEYLNLKGNSSSPFKTTYFFNELNNRIPNKFTNKPKYHQVLKYIRNKRIIEEADKIYFCGWRNNPKGVHVSTKNLQKTMDAFGKAMAMWSKKDNMSSCWTDNESKENLENINSMVSNTNYL